MINKDGTYGMRYLTVRSPNIYTKGRSVVLTEQSILDLKVMVKIGASAESIVEVLESSVLKASLDYN